MRRTFIVAVVRRAARTRLGRRVKPFVVFTMSTARLMIGRLWRIRRKGVVTDYDLVRSSPMFNDRWYRDTYPDVTPDVDAVADFLSGSTQPPRHPSALFDVDWYLSNYPDVAVSGLNPLVHYLRWGRLEGRGLRALGTTGRNGETMPLSSKDFIEVDGSIAVIIHAYYPDVFEELCPLLAHIPGKFALYVAAPSAEAARQIRASIEAHRLHADTTVRICQNRGRNFGTFLSEFSTEVVKYTYVLHLHTKKSLYTGTEQSAWRDHLYNALVGSAEEVKAIFALFGCRPDVGVVYPVIAPSMPYWAHHWLSNSGIAPEMFRRIGVANYQAEGLFDYPVGGMFWARVDALRPLFAANFRYEDFPLEEGQTDGTLAHAIERSIVFLARERGYGFAEIDKQAKVVRVNWSERNLFPIFQPESRATPTAHMRIGLSLI